MLAWLQRRWFLAAAVCLGLLLVLPSLDVGFVADDYMFVHRLDVQGHAASFRLYEFAEGKPGQHARLMSERWVTFPWWMSDDFKVRFLRPLSSGLFALDHALFGRAPHGYHVHSLVWYAGLLTVVGAFLRRICPAPTWQLAFLLFVLNGGHAESAAWLASRHVLVSTVPALLGLLALIAYRERGFRLGLPLALSGLLLALLGGESALLAVCYWLAYEALGVPGASRRQKAQRLLLPLGCAFAYLLLYQRLGYGAAGSAAYLDPLSRAFWSQLPGRLAMLLGELFTSFPSNLALTNFPAFGSALGLLATLGVALGLRSLWPSLEAAERRCVLWLSAAGLAALVLSSGAFLGSRLLLLPGIGGSVIIAVVLRHGWQPVWSRVGVWGRRSLVLWLALVHVALAPFLLVANCVLFRQLGLANLGVDTGLDAHFQQHRANGSQPPRVFVLAASDPFSAFYAGAVRVARSPDSTAEWSILSMARGTHRLERTAADKLVLQIDAGLLRSTFEGLFRGADQPFAVGDRAALAGAHVTVLAVTDGRPTAIELTLDGGSFDDPGVCLLAWREQRLVPVELSLHQVLSIPWSSGPTALL
jgi:hypothetical protein